MGASRASLDLADLALAGKQADVWNLRLVAGRRSYRLGTHLDGVTNRGEATEYPAARVGERRLRPYYTVENNISVRSEIGGGDEAVEPVDEEPTPGLARRLLGPPAVLVHRLALRLAGLRRGGGTADGRDVRILVLHAWGMGGTVRAVLSLAEALAESGRSVEIVSVVRRSGKPFFPFPDGVKVTAVDDQRKGKGGGRLSQAAEPARAPRGLRLSVVQPAHRPARCCGASARCRAASWSARARASTCSPPRSRPRARSPSPRST